MTIFFLFRSILKFDENEHYKLERTIFKINIKFRTFKNSKISKIQNFSTHVHNIFHMMIYLEAFIKNTTLKHNFFFAPLNFSLIQSQ